MFKIGDKVTCEDYDDEEVFDVTGARIIIEVDKNNQRTEKHVYDIESEYNFEYDMEESELHEYKEIVPRFIDRKEYELKLGLIVKYIEELDELVCDDGFSIEASCYDENLKCDFCNEFDIVTSQSDKEEPKKENLKAVKPIGVGVGVCCDCKNRDELLDKFKDYTFYIDGDSFDGIKTIKII